MLNKAELRRSPLSVLVEDFDQHWRSAADRGECDDIGGVEYNRVFCAWVHTLVGQNIKGFIAAHKSKQQEMNRETF
jgi:hypothetical protein